MYQIDSRKVDDYLKIMDDKLNEYGLSEKDARLITASKYLQSL